MSEEKLEVVAQVEEASSSGADVLPELSSEAEPVVQAPPSVGEILRQAREAKSMLIVDVARALKLSVRQVEALEAGKWDALPGSTFIRGFVRNYARQIDLDPVPLMQQLDISLHATPQNLSLPEQTGDALSAPGETPRRNVMVILPGLLAVVVAVGIYFFAPTDLSGLRESAQELIDRLGQKEVPVAAQPAQQEQLFPPDSGPQQVLQPPAAGESTEAAPVAAASSVAPPVVTPLPAAPAAGTEPVVNLVFSKESWVEIRDRDGKVLFSQRGAVGSEHAVTGQPPFGVVIGYVPGVRLQMRGQAVDLAPHARGDVARLTLE